jgi:hypothetical protein
MSYDYGFRKGEQKGASLFFLDEKEGAKIKDSKAQVDSKTKKKKKKKSTAKVGSETEDVKLKGTRFRNLGFFTA